MPRAYDEAGIAPADVDVVEVHDASAIGEILNAESLMLVPFGEGGPAAERGEFTIGGRMPINPSGGLESKGHPIGATGLGQIHELVTQLRGEAGKRQVDNVGVAIQENGGGLYGIGYCRGSHDPRQTVNHSRRAIWDTYSEPKSSKARLTGCGVTSQTRRTRFSTRVSRQIRTARTNG